MRELVVKHGRVPCPYGGEVSAAAACGLCARFAKQEGNRVFCLVKVRGLYRRRVGAGPDWKGKVEAALEDMGPKGRVRFQLNPTQEEARELRVEAARQEMGITRFVVFLLDEWTRGGRRHTTDTLPNKEGI